MTNASEAAPRTTKRLELTLRGLVLGAVLAVVFTGANVYLGLRVGLTFASAIPAAVISMAVLRAFRGSTIWENMTVQTVASVGGALSAIIFVMPGLVMVGWWSGFPFWQAFLVCALGGVLGVTFSIPLRRALVTTSILPYPEGVAAAEVLKVGSPGADMTPEAVAENRAGLLTVIVGAVASATFAFLASARLFAAEAATFFRLPAALGGGATGLAGGLSLALLGAGHLVGLSVGLAMLMGLVIAWGGAVPILTALQGVGGAAEAAAVDVWRTQVRFMGAGTIGVAALWTLTKLARPVVQGLAGAMAAQARRAARQSLERVEQDIPIGLVGLLSLICLAAIGVLFWTFLQGSPLAGHAGLLIAGGLIYVFAVGFLVAAVCGYMAGLIGSSNSPLSGVGILAIVAASLLLVGAMAVAGLAADPSLVAFALFVTAVVFAISAISNDNLQDLKTAQLVEATPWRQQAALIFGVLVGASVIPVVLDLLNAAYGFDGGPAATVAGGQPLPAPQAVLISSLARGVIDGGLRWDLIGLGALIGVVVILLDEALGKAGKMRLPPLAVGIGVYLPMATTMAVVIGAVAGRIYNRLVAGTRHAETARRLGVLLASGLIVGESLFGVFLAAVIVGTDRPSPFALFGDDFATTAMALGAVAFAAVVVALYAWTARQARKAA